MQSVAQRLAVVAGAFVFSGAVAGCSSSADGIPWGNGDDGGGSSAQGDGAPSGAEGGGGATGDAGTSGNDATAPDTGASEGGEPDTGSKDASSGAEAAVDSGGPVTSGDGFGPSRTACINKINALRATNTAVKLQPYMLVNTDTTNTCVDTQATNDQSKNSAHYSFINNDPSCTWGNAQGFAQDECEQGYGTSPAGIEQCLQDMWDESLKPNCAGCVGCTTFGGNCPNCDYSGSKGYECGHYVNMSAPYFTMVACGFAGAAPSSGNAWSVQNFE